MNEYQYKTKGGEILASDSPIRKIGNISLSLKEAFVTLWDELERISTEENHTATNIEARENLFHVLRYIERRPDIK